MQVSGIFGSVIIRRRAQARPSMEYTSVQDINLIAQIARGDRRAFEALYERYAGQVFGLAMRVVQEQGAAEDVTQETFCRVWQRAKSFGNTNTNGNVRAWLLTITHRLSIDHIRGHVVRNSQVIEMDAHDDGEWDIEDRDADVFEHAFSRMNGEQVRAAVSQLEDKHRHVIELAFFGGKTHREIAEQLGQPLGTVHSWALQGMSVLKSLLRQHATDVV